MYSIITQIYYDLGNYMFVSTKLLNQGIFIYSFLFNTILYTYTVGI